MSIESDATRLSMIKAVGGEEFETAQPENLWGVFSRESGQALVDDQVVQIRETSLMCRSSDVATHSLAEGGTITRAADSAQYRIKQLEPDGTGMTLVVLRS